MLESGAKLLRESYELINAISQNDQREVWAAADSLGNDVIVKTWRFHGSQLDEVQRQLWDVEQRNLYRLASSPRANEQLVVLREAGVHWNASGGGGYFVMALRSPGFDRLSDLLSDRSTCPWLRDIEQLEVRAELWRSIRGLAAALIRIHELQMLHRGISADNVFLNRTIGPTSMRLGGFEWTVRIGDPQRAMAGPEKRLFPPEFTTGTSSFSTESDWFMFGALLAHIFCAATSDPAKPPLEQYQDVFARIHAQHFLTDIERQFIDGLLTPTPETRMAIKHEILAAIDEIILQSDNPPINEGQYLGLVVQLGPQQALTEQILDLDETITALDIESQRQFIESDVATPTILRHRDQQFILRGRRLSYFISEHHDVVRKATGKWDLAFCHSPAEVRHSTRDDQREVANVSVAVFTQKTYRQSAESVLKNAVSWNRYLPESDERAEASEKVTRFHDFFRVTNQVELLMRDAEIFAYEVVDRTKGQEGETLVIREIPRPRELAGDFLQRQEMIGFLSREWQEKGEGDRVQLSDDEDLRTRSHMDLQEFWKITDIDADNETATVRRGIAGRMLRAPDKGFLRCYGMFGALKLIQRRNQAIRNLKTHTFLLQAFLDPGLLYMHSGLTDLPKRLDPELDDAKKLAIRNIWATRPIFAVQGPPGTGKTTLVVNLLEQIFEDDNVAQVLVSAQAHAAVDVLRTKVTEDVFSGVPANQRPLAIRIPRSKSDQFDDPDYPAPVTQRLLESARTELSEKNCTPIQKDWLRYVDDAIAVLMRRDTEAITADLVQLVERSANITYCTTTSASLARLAVSTQTFDWSIIEEAGKAHGFDLVLPLQNGHRWLLIGDHKQLPPYRYKDFRKALQHLDEIVDALECLQERGEELVDRDFVREWRREIDSSKKDRSREMWLSWLPIFDRLFQMCNERTGRDERPALSAMLTQQHRMHPTIAGLVSHAFYNDSIESMTIDEDGRPKQSVLHPFVSPEDIKHAAIVWLDLPSADSGGSGESTRDGPYTSRLEVDATVKLLNALAANPGFEETLDLAVLSPYRLQVFKLAPAVDKGVYQAKPSWLSMLTGDRRFASTVDSFQGNQADIVAVSLVRNNTHETKRAALGFLEDSERLNVLLSRAERLLVLVGSWDFFQKHLADVAADSSQPLGDLRLAFDYLSECFEDGRAVRVRADTITN